MIDPYFNMTDSERGDFFRALSDDEAKRYFEEYVGRAKERIEMLRGTFYETGGGDEDELGKDPESLVPLWKWAKGRLYIREFTAEELKHIGSVPQFFRDLRLGNRPLSAESLILVNDIGYYLGETIIFNLKGVHWAIGKEKVRRYLYENQPLLKGKGFKTDVSPRDAVWVAAMNTVNGRHRDDALIKIYEQCYNELE